MFIEPKRASSKGWIEVISGCMFSGKTEELIRRLNRAAMANLTIRSFKPAIDKRYHETAFVSHNANSLSSIPVQSGSDILSMAENADVIGIDETQFFEDTIVEVCETIAKGGTRIIVAGLNMNYLGKPFGPMPALMAVAEYVTKLNAICMVCGDLATHSFRKGAVNHLILLGEKDLYEARCRSCFNEGMKNDH